MQVQLGLGAGGNELGQSVRGNGVKSHLGHVLGHGGFLLFSVGASYRQDGGTQPYHFRKHSA